MNILLINNQEIKGGSAVVVKALMADLKNAGHEVNLLVAHKDSLDKHVYVIPTSKIRKVFSYLFSNDIDFYKTDYILNLDIFKRADIVNFHNLSGHYFNLKTLQKISKLKPTLWTFHDAYPINHYYAHSLDKNITHGLFTGKGFSFSSRILWYRKKYLKAKKLAIYKNSNFAISAPSQWLIDRIKKTVLQYKKIYLVPNGISNLFFEPINKYQARESLNLPLDKKIVLFIAHGGSKNLLKGWDYFLEVAGHYKDRKDILFLVIGEKISKVLGAVKFIKYISDKREIARYYAASDILFSPSLLESFGLVQVEAMAMGVPILSFYIGGLAEIITHKKNGYLAKYKDSQDLLDGFNYILNLSKVELAQMASRSREKIKNNFSVEKMTDNYLKVYKKVILNYENRN